MLVALLLLLLHASHFRACSWSNNLHNSTAHAKRSYYIGGPGSNPTRPHEAIWPPPEPGHKQRWLRYCFYDEDHYQTAHEAFFRGIAMWLPAMEFSNLRVRPDLPCGSNSHCICGGQEDPVARKSDALVIVDVTVNDPEMSSSCNIGYTAGRRYGPGYRNQYLRANLPSTGGKADDAENVFEMTHELGHAFGIGHEHERPDIMDWIQCVPDESNSVDFEAGFKRLDSLPDPRLPAALKGVERLQRICNDFEMMKQHFPDKFCSYLDPKARQIPEVDFDSVMIYDSYRAKRSGLPIVFKKHPHKKPDTNLEDYYPGGSPIPEKRSISVGDIQAIAKLYGSKGQYDATKALRRWEPMEVELPRDSAPGGPGLVDGTKPPEKFIVRQCGDNSPVPENRRVKLFQF